MGFRTSVWLGINYFGCVSFLNEPNPTGAFCSFSILVFNCSYWTIVCFWACYTSFYRIFTVISSIVCWAFIPHLSFWIIFGSKLSLIPFSFCLTGSTIWNPLLSSVIGDISFVLCSFVAPSINLFSCWSLDIGLTKFVIGLIIG
jgi:hypothetical protein